MCQGFGNNFNSFKELGHSGILSCKNEIVTIENMKFYCVIFQSISIKWKCRKKMTQFMTTVRGFIFLKNSCEYF